MAAEVGGSWFPSHNPNQSLGDYILMEVVARFVRNVLNGGDVGVVLSCVVYGGC